MHRILRILLLCCVTASAWTQHVISVRAGLITYAVGSVFLDGEPFQFRAESLRQLSNGRILMTAAGRAEVQLGPAASLWMEKNGSLRMTSPELSDTELRLERGSILIRIVDTYKDNRVRIRVGDTDVVPKAIGLYRIAFNPPSLYVFDGKAEIRKERKKKTVGKGRIANLDGAMKIGKSEKYPNDSFLNWALHRSLIIYRRPRTVQGSPKMSVLDLLEFERQKEEKERQAEQQRLEELQRRQEEWIRQQQEYQKYQQRQYQ